MKNKKLISTKFQYLSFVLALIILFSSVYLLAVELGAYADVATAKTADTVQASNVYVNDLTSDSNSVYLPSYDTEVITNSNLTKPNVTEFGAQDKSYYPSFTNKLSNADFDDAKKTAILAENQKMLEDVKAWYNEGTLQDNLQKHISADGQFSNAKGNYDDAPRIEKVITINNVTTPRKRSLGVFAPAGEVLTITIDESLVGKLTVNIGYPYGDSDIGSAKFDRWPNDRMARFFLSFELKSTVNYIGSPLGGMVTLNGVSTALGNFSITVSGGIDMPNYKLGVSTKEDWQNILAAPAPYVWLLTPHQYFVMPKEYIKDIEDPYQAMLWWHKSSMISMYSMAREETGHFLTPVISIFDSYVFIGEGVATVWAFYTNAPNSWCKGVLDYNNLMSNGSWGAIHEYNHHHQAHAYDSVEWGVGGITEITNNVLNALSYILLTDVAATRSENKILGVWSGVSDPYCNYRMLANTSSSKNTYEAFDTSKLFGFVDMMHTFGVEKFIDFLRAMYGYGEVDGYNGTNLNEDNYLTTMDGFTLFASLFFKTNFVDYFTDVWHFEISKDVIKQIKKQHFNNYFSVTNLYSSGIKGVETGRAYKVSAEEPTVLKLDEFTLCSTDNYKLTNVSKPQNGKLTKNGDGTYTYTPDKDFTQDSFDLTYKVKVGGKSYKRTLVVRLTSDNASEAETKSYPTCVDFRNKFLNRFYSDVIKYIPSEAKCLDNNGNDVKTVGGANIGAMFDGNTSTGFHTAWQGGVTAYPHNYYFTFDEETNFNRINFKFQDNGTKGYYAIGEYEIYTSEDGVEYKLLSSGKNEETNFSVQFDSFVKTKYVKLVVKSNASGKNFTNITEIEFAQGIDMGTNYNVYASDDAVFNYEDNSQWTTVTGNYMNSKAKHTDSGKVSFYMTGTDFMLYSTNAESKITIDGKAYTIKENRSNYSPSFIIDGLSNKKHLVVIEGNDMTLDMIKISTVSRKSKSAVNWAGLGIAIGIGLLFAGTATAVVGVEMEDRKKSA